MSQYIDSVYINLAFISSIFAILCTGYQIYMHLNHFHEPKLQLYIVRIILLVPMYSFASWLSLVLPQSSLIFDTLRDCYEAYVLYIFMQLLIQYLGGEYTLITHLELQGRLEHPWPFNQKFKPLQLNRNFFKRVKQGSLQFVLVKPITAILALILYSEQAYTEGSLSLKNGFIYISVINNISVSISLYCLVLFYLATEQRLEVFKPLGKFLVIKSVIFFSFWQSCIIMILLKTDFFGDQSEFNQIKASTIIDLIICFEMVAAAVAFSITFSYQDFIDMTKTPRPLLQNLGTVLNVVDVISDAHKNFLEEEEDLETPMREFIQIKSGKISQLDVPDDEEKTKLLQ